MYYGFNSITIIPQPPSEHSYHTIPSLPPLRENAVRIYGGGSGGGLLGSSSMNGKSQELYLRNSATTTVRSQKSVGRKVVVINATVYGGGLGGGLL